jgi:formate/nitrite transporter
MLPNPTTAFDALLPPEMAAKAEQLGVKKADMGTLSLFVLAGLAGAFISLGAMFATTVLAGSEGAPWGLSRLLAGLVFSLGLILVVVGGAELFTGNNLVVMAWAGGRVRTRSVLRNWVLVFAGNFAGALGVAVLVLLARVHEFGGGAVGVAALQTAIAKVGFSAVQAVALGILCNVLVCLAVWLTYSARTTTDRILAIVPPIAAFVAAGFEHSVANMYLVPFALLLAAVHPGFLAAHGIDAASLTWTHFVVRNLAPVTLGNVIGGSALVGGVYWFVYLRRRPAAGVTDAPVAVVAATAARR